MKTLFSPSKPTREAKTPIKFSMIRHAVWVAAVVCCSATLVEAALINVQVLGQSTGNPILPPNYSGAAATGIPGDLWNGYIVDSATNGEYSPPAIALSDSTGGTTGITFRTSAISGDNQAYVGGQGQSINGLINSYTYKASSATFTISGLLANTSYELYVYGGSAGNWTGYSMSVTIDSTIKTMSGATSFNSTGFAESVNYAHYASVTSDSVGTIVGTLAPDGGNGYLIFNGLQVIGAVPEPASLCLLALGGLFLGRRRRS